MPAPVGEAGHAMELTADHVEVMVAIAAKGYSRSHVGRAHLRAGSRWPFSSSQKGGAIGPVRYRIVPKHGLAEITRGKPHDSLPLWMCAYSNSPC